MNWTLFDYGVGNLHSLKKAVEAHGRRVTVTEDPEDLHDAEAILLPGVGAFAAVMASLEPAREALLAHHAAGKPLLGICIGMQVLYEGSQEAPGTLGLGILRGDVQAIPADAGKVPHMGWNTLSVDGAGPVADAMRSAGHVYYVHSYAAPAEGALATSTYGHPFAAAIQTGKTIGFQFHPEKSSQAGAQILGAAIEALEQP